MSDQRKDARKKLMAFTAVYDSISNSLLGYVGNINLSGMMVVSEHPSETGREVMLNVEFPGDLPGIKDKNLIIPAHVAWCNQEKSAQSYTIGFEFTKITAQQEAIIQAILERYHFRHNVE